MRIEDDMNKVGETTTRRKLRQRTYPYLTTLGKKLAEGKRFHANPFGPLDEVKPEWRDTVREAL
jgi:hypothetical protein